MRKDAPPPSVSTRECGDQSELQTGLGLRDNVNLQALASAERFELPTRSLGRSRSIQLSYADMPEGIIIAG